MSSKTVKIYSEGPQRQKLPLILKILLGLVVIIAVAWFWFFSEPNQFSVENSITISAPVNQIFKQVNNLHDWYIWSPWGKVDPTVKITYQGPGSGVGSVYHWVGEEVGIGNMVITESKENEHVSTLVDFLGPVVKRVEFVFTFEPEGKTTKVTWSVFGMNSFQDKIEHMLGKTDNTWGKDIQYGLEHLKAVIQPD